MIKNILLLGLCIFLLGSIFSSCSDSTNGHVNRPEVDEQDDNVGGPIVIPNPDEDDTEPEESEIATIENMLEFYDIHDWEVAKNHTQAVCISVTEAKYSRMLIDTSLAVDIYGTQAEKDFFKRYKNASMLSDFCKGGFPKIVKVDGSWKIWLWSRPCYRYYYRPLLQSYSSHLANGGMALEYPIVIRNDLVCNSIYSRRIQKFTGFLFDIKNKYKL
jgi:hypothetical protein